MEVILDERDLFLDFSAILKADLLFDWFGIDLRVFWNANLFAFLFFSGKKKERFGFKINCKNQHCNAQTMWKSTVKLDHAQKFP